MDIKKLKEELAKMPEQGYKKNMFVGKPKPITPIIKELAKELGIPVKEYGLPDVKDFGEVTGIATMADTADVGVIKPIKIEKNEKTTEFDTTAYFANKNLIEFWDEMNINQITGETFTNGGK